MFSSACGLTLQKKQKTNKKNVQTSLLFFRLTSFQFHIAAVVVVNTSSIQKNSLSYILDMKSHSINVFFSFVCFNLTLTCMCTVVSNVSLNNICDHQERKNDFPRIETDSCSRERNFILSEFCWNNFCNVPVKCFVFWTCFPSRVVNVLSVHVVRFFENKFICPALDPFPGSCVYRLQPGFSCLQCLQCLCSVSG